MNSASETAYFKIRHLIVSGQMRPGEPVIADDLARTFGLSRTPVREALLRLQAEMYVSRLDNKRTIVRPWSRDDIEDFIELRVRFSAYTAMRVAQRVTDEDLGEFRQIVDDERAALASDAEGDARQAPFDRFYTTLMRVARSERLQRITWQLLDPGPLMSMLTYNLDRYSDMLSDHRELVRAFEARDAAWAEAVMIGHVRKFYRLADLTADDA